MLDHVTINGHRMPVYAPASPDYPCAFPVNTAAELYVRMRTISWAALRALTRAIVRAETGYERCLLLKYCFVELQIFLELVERMQATIHKHIEVTGPMDAEGQQPLRTISSVELAELDRLAGAISAKAKHDRPLIKAIRDTIGAHGSQTDSVQAASVWANALPHFVNDWGAPLVAYLRHLDGLSCFLFTVKKNPDQLVTKIEAMPAIGEVVQVWGDPAHAGVVITGIVKA